MEDNRDDDKLVHVTLSAEMLAHYQRRAEAAGRTLEEQLLYELNVGHGLAVPDPGDTDAAQCGQVFKRMRQGRILQG